MVKLPDKPKHVKTYNFDRTFVIMSGNHEIVRLKANSKQDALNKFINAIGFYLKVREVTPSGGIIY